MTVRIGQKTEYFLSSHTGRGMVTFFKETLRSYGEQILLKGGTDQIRSRIIRNVEIELIDRGYNVEIAHGILNPDILEGIIIPQLNTGLVSAGPHWEARYKENIINLDLHRDNEKYQIYKSKIHDLDEQIYMNLELLWDELQQIQLVFAEKCNQGSEFEEGYALYITEKILNSLFTVDEGRMNHRFGQVLTSRGLSTYFPKLLASCSTKYYLNGVKYLSGSRLLRLVAREAVLKGFVVDVYHNFLDPELVELIILTEANLALGIRPFERSFQPLLKYGDILTESNYYLQDMDFEGVLRLMDEIEHLYDQCCMFYHETFDFHQISRLEKRLTEEILNN